MGAISQAGERLPEAPLVSPAKDFQTSSESRKAASPNGVLLPPSEVLTLRRLRQRALPVRRPPRLDRLPVAAEQGRGVTRSMLLAAMGWCTR